MKYTYYALGQFGPVIALVLIIIIVCIYFNRENRETYYSPRAMEQYLNSIKRAIWEEAIKHLHELRNQDKAHVIKTHSEIKKHKQAYMYSRAFLLKDTAESFGLYEEMPDYLRLWRDANDIDDQIDDRAALINLRGSLLSDTSTQVYYVYYDLDKHKYVWLDIAEAAEKPSVPMQTKAREIVQACSMLIMHFDLGTESRLEWQKLAKFDYLGSIINDSGDCIKMKLRRDSNSDLARVAAVQLFKNKDDLNVISDGSDLISVHKLFNLALVKSIELKNAEKKRISDFDKKQDGHCVHTNEPIKDSKIIKLDQEKEKDD